VNSSPQFDLHPDADSLNAFAEQALGAEEREQILAHLTRCGRCRQVIYLAQKAAEVETPESAALPSRGWYRSWRFAWVPAVALAAALALVVTFYPRHAAPAPEMAKLVPQSEQAAPTPVPQEQASAEAVLQPAHAANPAAGSTNFTALRQPPGQLALKTNPPAAVPAEESNAARTPATESARVLTPQESRAQFNPEPAVDEWQQRQRMTGAFSANANAARASQESMNAAIDRTQVNRSAPALVAAAHISNQAAPGASFATVTQETAAGSAALRNANPLILPSGLAAISTATARQHTLAIDPAGALFLSEDAGKHWEPVARQWAGRAITVRVQAGTGGAVFQLTNIGGSTWASADGKTWTAQ
jgi:hypothetical protein